MKNRGNTAPLTVQETIEDTLKLYTGLDRHQLQLRFAGHTDKGVHARGQVVVVSLSSTIENNTGNKKSSEETHVDLDLQERKRREQQQKLWMIRKSINSRLPKNISIENVSLCHNNINSTPSFDPRRDAKQKQYSYTLRYREQQRDDGCSDILHPICVKGGPQLLRTAFDSNRVWICPWALDDSKLKQYCVLLTGTHDYSPFVYKEARTVQNNQMTVTRFDYERTRTFRYEDVPSVWEVRFEVEAQEFGRSQVRKMIGFLVDICRGGALNDYLDDSSNPDNNSDDADCVNFWKIETDQLAKHIHAAPACGLCLEHVSY